MISKIPTQPFPFFNKVIRPVWRMMNTLIILIAFFIPWFSSYEVITICTSTADIVAIPDVATVTNKPVVVTVKNSNNMPQVGVPVYACNSQNIISMSTRTDMNGQAIFPLWPGSYRFAGNVSTTKNVVKTYNGFEATGLFYTRGPRFEPFFTLIFIGLLGLLVTAAVIFAKHELRIAFIRFLLTVPTWVMMFYAVIIYWLGLGSLIVFGALILGQTIITLLIFIGQLCIGVYALVSPVAIFSKYARRIAFFPLGVV